MHRQYLGCEVKEYGTNGLLFNVILLEHTNVKGDIHGGMANLTCPPAPPRICQEVEKPQLQTSYHQSMIFLVMALKGGGADFS